MKPGDLVSWNLVFSTEIGIVISVFNDDGFDNVRAVFDGHVWYYRIPKLDGHYSVYRLL